MCSEFEVEKILIEANDVAVPLVTAPCGSMLLMAAGTSCTLSVSNIRFKESSEEHQGHINTVFSASSLSSSSAVPCSQKITCSILVDEDDVGGIDDTMSYTLAVNYGSVLFIPANSIVMVTNSCETAAVFYRAHMNLETSHV